MNSRLDRSPPYLGSRNPPPYRREHRLSRRKHLRTSPLTFDTPIILGCGHHGNTPAAVEATDVSLRQSSGLMRPVFLVQFRAPIQLVGEPLRQMPFAAQSGNTAMQSYSMG